MAEYTGSVRPTINGQILSKGSDERIYFEFRNDAGTLTDPTTPTITIKDDAGSAFTDDDSTEVTAQTLTKDSDGVYYWTLKIPTASTASWLHVWATGTVDSQELFMDSPLLILVQGDKSVVDDSGLWITLDAVRDSYVRENNADYGGFLTDAEISTAIQIAEDEISDLLSEKYASLPFDWTQSTVPSLVQRWCAKWAAGEALIRSNNIELLEASKDTAKKTGRTFIDYVTNRIEKHIESGAYLVDSSGDALATSQNDIQTAKWTAPASTSVYGGTLVDSILDDL